VPPGPMILARVVNRCMRSTIKSFMGKQSRADHYQVQGLLRACFHAGSKNPKSTRGGRKRSDDASLFAAFESTGHLPWIDQ
jgi:hypothetical protein